MTRTFLTSFALAALLITASPPAEAQMRGMRMQDQDPPRLHVSGSATVTLPSDRAHVRFAVETEAATAREASAENARRMDAVIRALRETEADGLDIETSGYALQPRYARPERNQARVIEGYTARNHVSATVADTEAVGRLIDAAIEAGANRVAGLSFSASDTEEARKEAVRLAVETARSEAEAMAAALGATLGEPVEVRGGASAPPPVPFARGAEMMQAADAPTPVEPGDQQVTANVNITYRLIVEPR